MTLRELLNFYKPLCIGELEEDGVIFILEEALGLSRSEFLLSLDKNLNEEIEHSLKKDCDRYVYQHNPPQYIIGYTYFYGLKLKVNQNVLIPRFDTEVLVDEVLNYIENKQNKELDCVDIGTGSGAIAIAIKKNKPSVQMEAIDISEEALTVACINAKECGCNIKFYKNDLLSNVLKKYDIIVSNPPYIDQTDDGEEVMKIVDLNEPHLALYSQDKGLYHYKRIIEESTLNLKEDGVLFFEIPDNKAEAITAYALKYYKTVKVTKDYHQLRRVLQIGDRIK